MDTISSESATYVYGIASADAFANGHLSIQVPGIGGRGAPVRTVGFEDLVAVVSDVPGSRFDLTHENIVEHQRVLDEILRRSDVLPFSFGTIAGSDDEVRELLLRPGFDALHDQLACVRGCVELELKAFWDKTKLFAEIVEESEEVRALRDSIAAMPDEASATAKIALGQLTDAEIEAKSTWEAERLLDILEPIAVEILVNPNLTDTMLLNAAILVERSREAELDAAVYALGEAQVGRLVFNYVGPLPPYSFVDLSIQVEE
jgi:hypothetical protein